MTEPAPEDPVLRALREAPEDDEVDLVCPADGAWFLVGPGDTAACPDCGSAGRLATADELRERAQQAYAEGTISDDELRRRIDP